MKRISIAMATVAILAFAAVNTAVAADSRSKRTVDITGTVVAVASPQVQVLVKSAPEGSLLSKQVRGTRIWLNTDTATIIRRGSASTLTSLLVNDKVTIRAMVTLNSNLNPSTLTWYATRINVSVPRLPRPNVKVTGVIVTNSLSVPGTIGLVVTHADGGRVASMREKAVLGTNVSFNIDPTTTASKQGKPVALTTLVGFPAVNLTALCTTSGTTTCTVRNIEVLAPRQH